MAVNWAKQFDLGPLLAMLEKIDGGSTFCVTIDIREGKASDIAQEIAKPRVIGIAPGQEIPRILVAEDVAASMDDYLTKPIDEVDLMQMLHKWI